MVRYDFLMILRLRKYGGIAGSSFILVGLDLFTKFLAQKLLATPLVIWPGIFQLRLSINPGVAFSIPIPNIFMIVTTPLLISAIAWLVMKSCNMQARLAQIGLVLVVAGGTGNWLNRFVSGGVIDFLEFSFWPSFNLADTYLTIGAFLFILFYGRIAKNSET